MTRGLSGIPMLQAPPSLFDTPPEPEFDRLTALLAKLLDAPITLLSLIDERRSFFKSAQGLPEDLAGVRDVPLTHSLCRQVVEDDKELMIEDTRACPTWRRHKAVSELGVGSYLGVPVHGPDGEPLGAVCAIGTEARGWSARDREIMATFAKSIEAEIGLRAALARQAAMLRDLRAAQAALAAAREV